jgi:membrane glycosyltransferase
MATQAEKWIRVEPIDSPSPKTLRWQVVNTRTGNVCGQIRWWGAWWKYCFFPQDNHLFDADCMRLIADFMEQNRAARK